MHNYFTNAVIRIDQALLVMAYSLSLAIIILAVIQHALARRRNDGLLRIKQNLYNMVLAGNKPSPGTCQPFVEKVTLKQFLDVATNRELDAVFFNKSEQESLKACLDTPGKIQQLLKKLHSKSGKWDKIEASLILGYLGNQSAVPFLEALLYDKDDDVSYFAIIALGQIKTPSSAKALLKCLRDGRSGKRKIASILEGFPPEAADETVGLLKSDDPQARFWALKLLAKYRVAGHMKEIQQMASDKSQEVRSAACEALGALPQKTAQETLERCLRDPAWPVRASAVNALAGSVGEASIPAIIPLIRDNSLSVVEAVREAITAHIGAVIPYISGILEGDDALSKKILSEAIGNSGHIKTVIKEALSGDSHKSSAARNILKKVIESGSHFSIENGISDLDHQSLGSAIAIIGQIDPALGEHIEKKRRGELQEL